MAYFDKDGGGGGAVTPVYLKVKGTSLLQIFPTSYNEKHSCQLLGSPSETGQQQLDTKVVVPSTVQFTGIVKYAERDVVRFIYNNLRKDRKLEKLRCEFMSKAGRIVNMILENIEEIGEANRYDGIEIRVSLLEYLEHNPS